MVGLIIIVLLFSVVAIVALYTSPQPVYQIPSDSVQAIINPGSDSEAIIQWSTFTVGEENADSEAPGEINDTEVEDNGEENTGEVVVPSQEASPDPVVDGTTDDI